MGKRFSRPSPSSGKCSSSPLQSSGRTTKQRPCPSNTQEVPLRGVPEPEDNPYGLEANLHTHFNSCRKNPGHHEFIPVRDFKMEHLPEKHRKKKILKAIKAGSELCVHIKATNISEHRPEFYPDSTDRYPFHLPGGGYKRRDGSGYVMHVYKCGKGCEINTDTTCYCDKCLNSPSPERTYWEVRIETAAHVICEEEEVEGAEITFDLDSSDTDSSITIKAGRFDRSDIEGDYCWITVPVHEELGRRLKKALDCYRRNRERVDWGDLVVVASHPHGCSKHISVGECVRVLKLTDGEDYCVYTTSTCPGSSGGLVMGRREDWEGWWWGVAPHSEALIDGTNRSGMWWGWLY